MEKNRIRGRFLIAAGVVSVVILSGLFILLRAIKIPASESQKGFPLERQLSVTYLSPVSGMPEVWRRSLNGQEVLQISHTLDGVDDYAGSADGETILFSTANRMGGSDIWIAGRDGNTQQILVECKQDRCYGLSYAGNTSLFSYFREATEPNGKKHTSINLFDVEKKEIIVILGEIESPGVEMAWSSDGKRLAVYDSAIQKIRIWKVDSREEILLDANNGLAGSWFPDSLRILALGVEMYKDGNPLVKAYSVHVINGEVVPLTALNDMNLDISQPVVSPNGNWIALAGRTVESSYSRQVWIFDMDGILVEEATRDENYTHASLHWNAAGDRLVYQRLEVNSSDSLPEVWLWQGEGKGSVLLAKDASLPMWLP